MAKVIVSHVHTLQSVTNWSMQWFEGFEVLSRGFSICIGVGTSISRRRSAGSAARYSVTVDAGMGQVYHEGFCRGNCNVRIHAESAHIQDTARPFASQMSKCRCAPAQRP